MRTRGNSVLANPVLVGAVTILVTVVAVFLAYNANNGLPFVPTLELKVRLSNGAALVPGNEVRSGGYRVGVISDIEPVARRGGGAEAELTLKLDRSIGDVPRDSTAVVRPRSALGLKYLDLREGHSRRSFADGDVLPRSQTTVPVDIDRVFGIFDKRTRDASQGNLQGFGDALAGRGVALGRTIDELPRLFGHLEPVMRTLSAPDTHLDRFFAELGDAARIVAPVSRTQAHLFTTMADTFRALGHDPPSLKAFIAKGPRTLEVSTGSLRAQRPFLADVAGFGRDFSVATHELRAALPDLSAAVDTGIGTQRRAVGVQTRLRDALAALDDLAAAPSTPAALRELTGTVGSLNPQLRFYGPFQTVCNYWNSWFTTIAEHFSEPDTTGHVQRALVNFAGQQDNSFGSMGANAPANGQNVHNGAAQYMHGGPYGAAIGPDGRADCETGQRGYMERDAHYFPSKYRIQVDPRTAGLQGPTFTGRARVPAGETYAALPETGPYKDILPSEAGGK
ncbi:MAG: phospholipid/cholesterol/gamma-HCH transport system substrate-binding protein [Solirubrobacteraceae bacterium]|nr:phospholipid/cholesterol/gamma-HCH transport system substrate-binding protein [Solirubrobacteraceae bacterium]